MKNIQNLSILGLSSLMILTLGCSKDKKSSIAPESTVISAPVDSADTVAAIPVNPEPLPPPSLDEVLDGDLAANPSLPEIPEVKIPDVLDEEEEETAPVAEEDNTPVDSTPAVPKGFAIKAIASQGDGCPSDSTAINISEDKKAFTITFSQFQASLEAGTKKSEIACRLSLSLEVPVGWQYAVASFNYRGFLALDEGVEALHSTRYFFTGKGKGGGFRHREVGEISKDFVYSDKVDILTAVLSREWSACTGSRDLNIDTAIRLRNTDLKKYPNASGLFSNDSTDGELSQEFGLTWRRCR
ncbi:MAG: DUF4360 domain-containing protein [Proteobacteria bacterium]|nr:MAG: DUF4360 domain-containing protein [Pseudomonadota bacterium]